jgi:hypothetical protein
VPIARRMEGNSVSLRGFEAKCFGVNRAYRFRLRASQAEACITSAYVLTNTAGLYMIYLQHPPPPLTYSVGALCFQLLYDRVRCALRLTRCLRPHLHCSDQVHRQLSIGGHTSGALKRRCECGGETGGAGGEGGGAGGGGGDGG